MHFGIFEIVTLLGSLGLFLYGMQTMSDALMAVAGDKMRKVLASMTRNRFLAILTGFVVTAVIQSSSATTLMVVSFVNAQLLTLTEAIGVVMGANIGTTVTAWVITMLGFKISMSALALPLVGLGFVLSLSKKPNRRNWGAFTIGFAVLFIGLQFLKDSVPDIKENPQALEWIRAYTDLGYLSVLLFLLLGTLLTVIIQSSSATMALTLVMCFEGWIPFEMAAAMVLGENIGTTITANLASIVGGHNGKRAARAHLIFNLLGVMWMLVLFYPFLAGIEYLVTINGEASPYENSIAIPVALSTFHTVFNVLNTTMLVWFLPHIEKMVTRLVPASDPEAAYVEKPVFLNSNVLSYSPTAIKALIDESRRVFDGPVYEIMAHAFNVHRSEIRQDIKSKELVARSKEVIAVDINDLYYKKIKGIYGLILEYTSKVTALFKLSQDKADQVYQIRAANRKAISAIKEARSIQKNIDKYMVSTNPDIRAEYNLFRKTMIKILRAVYVKRSAEDEEQYTAAFGKLREKLERDDYDLNQRLQTLVGENRITNEMAVSLMNDSNNLSAIANNLMEAVELLYVKSASMLDGLETDLQYE